MSISLIGLQCPAKLGTEKESFAILHSHAPIQINRPGKGWLDNLLKLRISMIMSRPIFLICLQMSIRLGYYVNIFLDF